MIDIHCHILPGIDDGPSEIEQSIEMAKMAAADGITRIVATPHINHSLTSPDIITGLVRELNVRLRQANVDIEVLAGADVNSVMDPSILGNYTINGSNYILIEFPHTHLPGNARELIFGFSAKGFRPIISHPERNGTVLKKPDLVAGLIDSGALVQVTAGSISGGFGNSVRKCCLKLLRMGLVHIVATDAHSPEKRPPLMSEAFKEVESIFDRITAMSLFKENPGIVISGKGFIV